MNPANLPDLQDAPHGYGVVQTAIFLAVYVLLVIGIVTYLCWKLPRHGAEPREDRGDKRPPADA